MKKTLLFLVVLAMVSSAGFGDVIPLNAFEDTAFETVTGASDSIALANSTDCTEGARSLEVTYTYTADAVWVKNAIVAATYETPLDLSQLELFRFDLKVPTADPNFMMTINLVDEKGFEARFVDYSVFAAASDWQTFTYRLSQLQKDMWVNQGRAANLKKIVKIAFHVMNGGDLASPGTLSFLLDDLRYETNLGLLNEVLVEGFESYSDEAALDAAWLQAFTRGTASLDTSNAYTGSKCLKVDADITEYWSNHGAYFTFATPQDFSQAMYFKLAVFGDAALAGLNPTAHLFLEDTSGNRATALIWNWPEAEEWTDIYLPFANQGILPFVDSAWTYASYGYSCWREDRWDGGTWDAVTDLTQISKIYLSIEIQTAGSPGPVEIYFDDVRYGLATDAPPVASVKTYDVSVIDSESTPPVIDGQVGAGEWDLAVSPGCTGFVRHNDNTIAASEDPEVKALFNSGGLYILYQVTNADFALAFDPTGQVRDPEGVSFGGDDFELFIAPGGNMADHYYHVVFFPDQAENFCYIWDEFDTGGATSWDAPIDQAAFSYNDSTDLLTIEYRIPWSSFNQSTALVSGAPADGEQWGIQIGYINNNPAEAVNWEPDTTPGFAAGRPYGTWTFVGEVSPSTGLESWSDYR